MAKNGKPDRQVRVTLNGVAVFDRKRRGYKRIMVKVVDVYGNEPTMVRELA